MRSGKFGTYIDAIRCLILFQLQVYTGQRPFHDVPDAVAVGDRIGRGIRPKRPDASCRIAMPDNIWHLVQKCWKQEASERPSFSDVVADLQTSDGSTR
jgi:hypothetical protein